MRVIDADKLKKVIGSTLLSIDRSTVLYLIDSQETVKEFDESGGKDGE